MRRFIHLLPFCTFIIPSNAFAQPSGDVSANVPEKAVLDEPQDEGAGINLDVGIESAYVFRGLNVFQDDGQMDQTLFLAPSLSWTVPGTELSLGYWGAYQLTGEQIGEKVDAGLGAEQDLLASYAIEIGQGLSASIGLVYYFYPLADEQVAGVDNPSFLEPNAGIEWESVVDLSIAFAYFAPVQEELESLRYLYINPSIGKTVDLSESVRLETAAGFGYKQFGESELEDNKYDVSLKVGVPVAAGGGAYASPLVAAAWTNFESRDFGDEVVVWGGVHVGLDL